MRRALFAVALVALGGCAASRVGGPWRSPLARDHALVGRIWGVAAVRFVDVETLERRLAASRFVLLGERHDNADHHRLETRLTRAIYQAGRGPALALEMVTPAQTLALRRYLDAHPRDAGGAGSAIGWDRSGWPPWAYYAPIAQAALDARARLLAANLDAPSIAAVARGGLAAVDPALVRRFELDRPLGDAADAALAAELRDVHCGLFPEAAIPGIVMAQRARDAAMAAVMLDAGDDGAILIAGAGHTRRDRGVPALLGGAAPGAATTSVAFVEVADDWRAPGDYAARFGVAVLPFDFVWFTPRTTDDDPCAALRRNRSGATAHPIA